MLLPIILLFLLFGGGFYGLAGWAWSWGSRNKQMAQYCTVPDCEARYPARDLIQITNQDPTALTVNATVLARALVDASAEIDGYLGSRYILPLVVVPDVLSRVCSDIGVYRLMSLRPLHDIAEVRARYVDATKWLTLVAAGKVQLGINSVSSARAVPDPVVQIMPVPIVQSNQGITPKSLRRI